MKIAACGHALDHVGESPLCRACQRQKDLQESDLRAGMLPPELRDPPDHETTDGYAFCSTCIERLQRSPEGIRKLLVMATALAEFYAAGHDLLWRIDVDDIDLVKQLRMMFVTSPAPVLAREAMAELARAGVRPHG